jgi:alpha-1,2-mannosyltransferase
VWLVPALVVLLDLAAGRVPAPGTPAWWRRRSRLWAGVLVAVTAVVLASSAIWFAEAGPGRHHDLGVLGIVVEDLYLLVTLAVVALLPARAVTDARVGSRRTAPSRPGGSSPR